MARKQAIIFCMLVGFAVWPLVHHGMVRAFDLNPWKYGGWAMYTTSGTQPQVVLFAMRGGSWQPLIGEQLSDSDKAHVFRLLGSLATEPQRARPDTLGRALLAGQPGAQRIRVQVRTSTVDRDTANVHIESRDYDFER